MLNVTIKDSRPATECDSCSDEYKSKHSCSWAGVQQIFQPVRLSVADIAGVTVSCGGFVRGSDCLCQTKKRA